MELRGSQEFGLLQESYDEEQCTPIGVASAAAEAHVCEVDGPDSLRSDDIGERGRHGRRMSTAREVPAIQCGDIVENGVWQEMLRESKQHQEEVVEAHSWRQGKSASKRTQSARPITQR